MSSSKTQALTANFVRVAAPLHLMSPILLCEVEHSSMQPRKTPRSYYMGHITPYKWYKTLAFFLPSLDYATDRRMKEKEEELTVGGLIAQLSWSISSYAL